MNKRPLPTREDAVAYAREMLPEAKWPTIVVASGTTDDGGDGIQLQDSRDCWIITYALEGEERLWVDKATGVVVKMVLDE
jgi:hypothetical protein